ncbi:MAG: AraC family transcriptional regulator [Acidobacteriota bacterium]
MNITPKALWYIESHLSADLSLDSIAGVVGVSRFHLSRAFGLAAGCALTSYVRGRRLSEAAKTLATGAPDILGVALDAGYGSHEAFTRAFRQHFGLTPEQVRERAHTGGLDLLETINMNGTTSTTIAPPRIVRQDTLLIFGLSQRYHRTNAGIPSQWDRFVPYLGKSHPSSMRSRAGSIVPGQIGPDTFGVICNTDDTGSNEYICGVQVSEFPAHPAEFARLRIPPQTYAVFEHKDHVSAVVTTWTAIWNNALSGAGYAPFDGPAFERYGEQFDGRTGLGGFEIWVPIKS